MKDSVQRLIRLDRAQDDALRKMAFDQRTSVAAVVRQIIERYFSEEKKPK